MTRRGADRLVEAVAELEQHGHDDLPEGPSSPLEYDPGLLKSRREPEVRRLAKLGREIVDGRLAKRNSITQNVQVSPLNCNQH